jgi:hypothetical protein
MARRFFKWLDAFEIITIDAHFFGKRAIIPDHVVNIVFAQRITIPP